MIVREGEDDARLDCGRERHGGWRVGLNGAIVVYESQVVARDQEVVVVCCIYQRNDGEERISNPSMLGLPVSVDMAIGECWNGMG